MFHSTAYAGWLCGNSGFRYFHSKTEGYQAMYYYDDSHTEFNSCSDYEELV